MFTPFGSFVKCHCEHKLDQIQKARIKHEQMCSHFYFLGHINTFLQQKLANEIEEKKASCFTALMNPQ